MNGSTGIWADGTLAVVTITGLGAAVSLEAEDVGADKEKADRENVRLGEKLLFTKEQLRPLTSAHKAARRALRLNSLSFPIGYLRFVPNGLLATMQELVTAAQTEHQAAIEKLKANLDEYMGYMLREYPDQLKLEDYAGVRTQLESGTCLIRLHTFSMSMTGTTAGEERRILDEFTRQAITDLRETVGAAASKLVRSLADGKAVNERSLNALRALVARSRDANFLNDPVTNANVEALQQELDKRTAKDLREDEAEAKAFRRSLELIVKKAEATADVSKVAASYMARVVEVVKPTANGAAKTKSPKRVVETKKPPQDEPAPEPVPAG